MAHSSVPTTTPSWREAARRRTQLFWIAAVLLALLAGFLAYQWQADVARRSLPDTPVLVAAVDIAAGETIQAGMVKTEYVPSAVVPETRLSLPGEAVGRIAQVNIVRGEVIVAGRLVGGGAGVGGPISARLPSGLWAVNIPFSWFIAPPPAVKNGDRVEIAAYLPGTTEDDAGLIVSAAQIIADPEGGSLVLAVTLDQAFSILKAHAEGLQLLILLRPAGN